MTNDAFLSIVSKDCAPGELLVRARRPGDIEKVFDRRTKVMRSTDSDYLYRAVIERADVVEAMEREVNRIDYGNFKDSVVDEQLHAAYLRVWTAMSQVQDPPPYSEVYRGPSWPRVRKPRYDIHAQVAKLGADSLLPPVVKAKRKKKGVK